MFGVSFIDPCVYGMVIVCHKIINLLVLANDPNLQTYSDWTVLLP